MTLNLRYVELFLAAAEDLHFSNAAERLGVPQPAMSRAIRLLEQDLGVVLFERNSRKVALTPAGRLFQLESQGALDQLAQAVRSARAAADGQYGVLRIGYMDFALEGVVPKMLKEFRSRYAGVSVVAKASFTEQIRAELKAHHIDIGFLLGPVEDTGLAHLPVQDDGFVVVLPETHRLAREPEVRLKDLIDEPLIMGRRETWAPYLRAVESLCRAKGFTPNIVQEADSTEGIFAFIACGMGSTVYVERAFNYNPPGIVVRPLKDVSTTVTSEIAWRTDDDSPVVRNFIALTKEIIRTGQEK